MDLNIKITTKDGKSFYDVQFNTTTIALEINQGADVSYQLRTPSIIKEKNNPYETEAVIANEKMWSKIHGLVLESMQKAQDTLEECGSSRWFPEEGLHVVIESDQDEINLVLLKEYLQIIICLMFKFRTEN